MPLLFHRHIKPEGELGLWRFSEEESYFLERLQLFPKEQLSLEKMKGHRRLEWLAGRWLLHLMSGREDRGACLKDEYGKPYLENSLYEISISHSRELTSVMASPRLVGVDIQRLVGKIDRIAYRFMRSVEMDCLDGNNRLEHLHVFWGAKEALYKAYGRKQLDFRKHIFVEPFSFDLNNGRCKGYVEKDNYHLDFDLYYEQIDDYILVYGTEAFGDARFV